MSKLNEIKEFIKYIIKHRKESTARIKETIHSYNLPVRICIKCNSLCHDLHKISPFSIFKYSQIYNDAVRHVDFSKHRLLYEFSEHDEWIYTPLAIETIRDSKLFRAISKFNKEEIFETEEDLEELVDKIKKVLKIYVKNPASF